MKVWLLTTSHYNMQVAPVNYDSVSFSDFVGLPIKDWKAIQFEVIKKGKYQDYAYYIGGVPVFNTKSIEVLGNIMANDVQLLNIDIINSDIEMKIVHITNVINAIDYTRSIPDRTLHGKLSGFKQMNFLEAAVRDQIIFRIKEFPKTRVYVTETFRNLVLNSKLKGFEFIEVWDSERTDEMEEELRTQYQEFLLELNKNKGHEFSWSEAIEKVGSGKAVASGEWKIQKDRTGLLYVARLSLDCEYVWMKSEIVPPILLSLQWHEVEKLEL